MDKNNELQKVKKQNKELKDSIDEKEKALAREKVRVTELEHVRDLDVQLKEDEINERRLLMAKNEELKKEIEAKDQINNMKIQKKLKDKSTGQLKDLTLKWEDNQKNLEELKEKIKVERDKIYILEKDKISLANSLEVVVAQLKEVRTSALAATEKSEALKKQQAEFEEEVAKNAAALAEAREQNKRLKEANIHLQSEQLELKCKIDSMRSNVRRAFDHGRVVRHDFCAART